MRNRINAGFLLIILGVDGYAVFLTIKQPSIGSILASIILVALALSLLLYIRPKKVEKVIKAAADTDESL